MKAIVANLLAGSYCLAMISPAWANPFSQNQESYTLEAEISKIWSAKTFGDNNPWLSPTSFEDQIFDYVLLLEETADLTNIIRQDNWLLHQELAPLHREILAPEILSLNKNPYLYSQDNQNLIVGLHNNFWSRENNQKYYGLTTIEQWGNGSRSKLSLKKLNYFDSAPILPQGTSALTLSGGGRKKILQENNLLKDFNDFRGGVTFHQGLAEDLTVGLGFFYDDLILNGFSQFTYKPDNFPLKTTLSLINNEQGASLYSHLQFKPAKTFVIDFYGNETQQKFAFNWKINPELNLIATGNRQQENLRTGGEFSFKNDVLSLSAKTEVSNNNEIQWKVRSQIGPLHLKYEASAAKTNFQMNYVVGKFNEQDWQSSLFVKNQTNGSSNNLKNLAILGWRFQSNSKVDSDKHVWQLDLGYGQGSQGEGAIISAAKLVKPGLYLKLSYKSVSLDSDETKIQLKLISTR
ncbi:MAG: hypothetical protein QNJ55_21010 [Xenococcus sp. MO_188.B8]|nr:hypothetical protein [Xenococcus sp. MO_188.B8]